MLSVRLRVRFSGDWTERIGELRLKGDIYTATLHERQYRGFIRIRGEGVDEAIGMIEDAEYHTDVTVVRRTSRDGTDRASILVEAHLEEQTPYLLLLENGFMPLDPTILADGCEFFDLFVRDRERFIELVDLLEPIANVTIERVISDIDAPIQPSPVSWQQLSTTITDRQFEAIERATDLGYFSVPREATLTDIADEMGIDKSTAGEHLRRGLGHMAAFFVEESRFS
ncbi:helix-turn-helix domain-containing protein [Natrinema sp. LN54]|uniref:helix-turn-helix domain-containing protein n=1 Tax=Natrinema sp. LN54 TaxID=3458705 RepID=UPI0040356CC0